MSLTTRPLIDDLCTWRGSEWVAAAGEGGTVDRDWSSSVTNKRRGSKILLVVVESMSHSPYVLLSHYAKLRPQQQGRNQAGAWGAAINDAAAPPPKRRWNSIKKLYLYIIGLSSLFLNVFFQVQIVSKSMAVRPHWASLQRSPRPPSCF